MKQLRCILGDELPLAVRCVTPAGVATAPDAAPTMKICTEAGVLVLEKQIPPIDRYGTPGLFGYRLPINSLFAVGRYFALFSYALSGTTYTPPEPTYFEIKAGGHVSGQYIALVFLERPDGNDWLIGQTDQGEIKINRGPRV